MKQSELPQEWQDKLNDDRKALHGKAVNTPYELTVYDETGYRYFHARRVCRRWNDDKGRSMPFGGGSYWTLSYGRVQFRSCRNVAGQKEYELCRGTTFCKSANGTEIPRRVDSKADAVRICKKIGIFKI